MLGIKPRASYRLGKCSTTELHPQTPSLHFLKTVLRQLIVNSWCSLWETTAGGGDNHSRHLHTIYVPCNTPNTLYIVNNSILPTILWSNYYFYLHFPDEETLTQKVKWIVQVIWLRSSTARVWTQVMGDVSLYGTALVSWDNQSI
jgi:hypothetical protein